MVLPIDEPPDQLYRLITHELTHVFEFDIIPRGLISARYLPLWMDEGLANYMAGYWNVLDLMQVRDAALTDNVPKMSEFEAEPLSGRLPYSMGHADVRVHFEAKWGKDGLRQFLFSLRKNVIGGGESAYEEALKPQARGVRRAVRSVPQGAVQAVPRQGAASRLRTQPRAAARQAPTTCRCSRSSPRHRAT